MYVQSEEKHFYVRNRMETFIGKNIAYLENMFLHGSG